MLRSCFVSLEYPVMSQVIRISDELYKRLAAYTVGFDTPSNVIERILNEYEGVTKTEDESEHVKLRNSPRKLEITFRPATEKAFKEKFLEAKKASIKIFYTNGEVETLEWFSPRFAESSNVSANLRSGCLRNWKEKGIFKAEVSIAPVA